MNDGSTLGGGGGGGGGVVVVMVQRGWMRKEGESEQEYAARREEEQRVWDAGRPERERVRADRARRAVLGDLGNALRHVGIAATSCCRTMAEALTVGQYDTGLSSDGYLRGEGPDFEVRTRFCPWCGKEQSWPRE